MLWHIVAPSLCSIRAIICTSQKVHIIYINRNINYFFGSLGLLVILVWGVLALYR